MTDTLSKLRRDVGELLEKFGSPDSQKRRDLTKYRDRPVAFIREVLKGEPWQRQLEIAESVRDNRLNSVASCNGAGKDWLAAAIVCWWVFAVGGFAILTAPTERQVVSICMRGEVRRHFQRGDLQSHGELYTNELRVPGAQHAGALAMVSSEASKLAGFHAPRVLVVLTEANGVEQYALDALLGCATGPNDRVLAVGNPLADTQSWFRASHQPSSPWQKFQISAFDHPNLTGGTFIHGGPSGEWIAERKRDYGEGSPWYIARVLGQFPDATEDALTTRAQIVAAVERWQRGDLAREANNYPVVVSVDPARHGADATACCVAQGMAVRELKVWRGADTMATTGKVVELLRSWNVRCEYQVPAFLEGRLDPAYSGELGRDGYAVVDTVGLGAGVYDRLIELGYSAEEFHSSARPSEPARFYNKRAEYFWRLKDGLEKGTVALPPDELLAEELLAIRMIYRSDGKLIIENKPDIKARLGRSPDRADAVAMALGGQAEASTIGGTVVPGW